MIWSDLAAHGGSFLLPLLKRFVSAVPPRSSKASNDQKVRGFFVLNMSIRANKKSSGYLLPFLSPLGSPSRWLGSWASIQLRGDSKLVMRGRCTLTSVLVVR